MRLIFEWDARKARTNIQKHKVSFEEAKTIKEETTMQAEYDFSTKKGVRGKYHRAYQQGHTVKIIEEDGKMSIHYFTLEDGAIFLEPDIRKYFPTPESVNNILRSLIALAPKQEEDTAQAK